VWLDPIFDVYGACGRLLDAATLDALDVLSTSRPPSASALRAYLERLAAEGVPRDEDEGARLEHLERIAARWTR
ncbi:MAG: hypothetical protein K8H88_05820, partial [Sandaracinaceae bacterium]|nr:hypothetical protein [Sandaracinaceae bacterium]